MLQLRDNLNKNFKCFFFFAQSATIELNLNKLYPSAIPSGISKLGKLLQHWKAPFPIEATLRGISTVAMLEHP
jgi:hypothetical protein